MKATLQAALTVLLLSTYPVGAADIEVTTANIKSLLTSSSSAECYAELDKEVGSICDNHFVSFDCKGDFIPATAGERNFRMAQLAFALKKPVTLIVDDTKQQGNRCVVTTVNLPS